MLSIMVSSVHTISQCVVCFRPRKVIITVLEIHTLASSVLHRFHFLHEKIANKIPRILASKCLFVYKFYEEFVTLNNDNNDNIRAGAKFDAGGGAETSFPLTVA